MQGTVTLWLWLEKDFSIGWPVFHTNAHTPAVTLISLAETVAIFLVNALASPQEDTADVVTVSTDRNRLIRECKVGVGHYTKCRKYEMRLRAIWGLPCGNILLD